MKNELNKWVASLAVLTSIGVSLPVAANESDRFVPPTSYRCMAYKGVEHMRILNIVAENERIAVAEAQSRQSSGWEVHSCVKN
ncbi:hypothetical protein [Yersinia ruckeri]|uniref:hypothetical protein n=1 Tax=Yersinia ruckeri TaxID=29486 RepID=UPI001F1E53B7|nr:hypothetical protein [Yersinia ruckeri]UIM99624.1 hypothetical protein LGL91_10615 [Yersinia ruckeri]